MNAHIASMSTIKQFSEIKIEDIPLVGGKNASLGEMYSSLSAKGIKVPEGFAVAANGYWKFLEENKLEAVIRDLLAGLNISTFDNLPQIALQIRTKILEAYFPKTLEQEILEAYRLLIAHSGADKTFAVRSSATAEDLPNASFAGQQETYLNVKGEVNLIRACHRCYASLFTDRAIKYRVDNGFDHMKVALSIG
ncbi:MAG: phosphoenolpyruvate synthase, partial [Chitinophagales bacterium]|nr:phosphoenolpyruvate synthase [Chitinophagales bacterium]